MINLERCHLHDKTKLIINFILLLVKDQMGKNQAILFLQSDKEESSCKTEKFLHKETKWAIWNPAVSQYSAQLLFQLDL